MSDQGPLIVIATILNERGPTGVQTHFQALRGYLDECGQRSILVTPFSAPKFLVYPIFAVRRIIDPLSGVISVWWYRYWHSVFLSMALKRVLSKTRNCVVYAQCPPSAHAALEARRTVDQRVVMAVHFNGSQADEWSEKGRIGRDSLMASRIRALELAVLPSLDGIVYVSRYMKIQLEARIPSLKKLSNAVIPNFCRPMTGASKNMETVDVISVGSLEPRKNHGFILEVLAHAARQGRRYTLALIGDGPDRVSLERHARALGIEGQVRFLGNRPGAIEFMGSARLYVHSAFMENLPLAIIEAMASGLPILAPAVGGIPDLFGEGEEGFFWKLDDVPAAAELLIRTLEDASGLERMSNAARARFDGRFDEATVARRLYAFIVSQFGAARAVSAATPSPV
jgi:glycosyltransferase involved in cell wall biosynthesis